MAATRLVLLKCAAPYRVQTARSSFTPIRSSRRQLLYRDLTTEGLGQAVDLGHYVSEIASAVMHTYAVDGIRLDLKVDHAPISINVAMPVGLLVNELLTNAFKHAFSERESGTITVRCLHEHEVTINFVHKAPLTKPN